MKTKNKASKMIGIVVLLLIIVFPAGCFGWEKLTQSELYGVYVRLEREDVASVVMSYDGFSSGGLPADGAVWETGKYYFMNNDIMKAAKAAGAPVYFTVTAKRADGAVLAFGEFQFDAYKEKMFLTFTADGRIEVGGWENDQEKKLP